MNDSIGYVYSIMIYMLNTSVFLENCLVLELCFLKLYIYSPSMNTTNTQLDLYPNKIIHINSNI